MQKKLIVLALAAISAAPAFAQSNVTIYGRIDYAYVNRTGNSGGVNGVQSKGEFLSGGQAGSRIGFRGNEDLGNGLKAIFQYEFGTNNDQQQVGANAGGAGTAAVWANRNSYVGLTGNFGTVVGGRLDGVRYNNMIKFDAFKGGTVGNSVSMVNPVDRADNAVAYVSPKFAGGAVVTAAYTLNLQGPEANGNANDFPLWALKVDYDNGPISLLASYEKADTKRNNGGASSTLGAGVVDPEAKTWMFGGSYDFGMVQVLGYYDSFKLDVNPAGVRTQVADYRDYSLGIRVPFAGKFTGKLGWTKVDDKLAANADATKWGIGLDYKVSARTSFYADYAKISNKNLATNRIGVAANQGAIPNQGAAAAAGGLGVKGFDIGIAHTF